MERSPHPLVLQMKEKRRKEINVLYLFSAYTRWQTFSISEGHFEEMSYCAGGWGKIDFLASILCFFCHPH